MESKYGISVVDAEISMDDHLVFTMSDGSIIDAGELPKTKGKSGSVFIQRQQSGELPSATFASLPAASSATNQVYRISDVGPAPGISLTSNGTIWRPAGGRQVLAIRTTNPVTVQNTAGAVAETLGPFPGGLVRAGMRLEIDYKFSHSGISTGTRSATLSIGNGTPDQIFNFVGSGASHPNINARASATIDVLSDTSANHYGAASGGGSFSVGFVNYLPTVDFSADWSMGIKLTSVAETAVNISSATWAADVVTFNTSAAHTLAVGDKTTIAGVTPSGYNGVFVVVSVPDSDTFTAALVGDPGAYTSGGTSSRISNVVSKSYVLYLIG